MECRECREYSLNMLDGTLFGKTERQVREHLTACAACREYFEGETPLHIVLNQKLNAIPKRLPSAQEKRLIARLEAEMKPSPLSRFIWSRLKVLAAGLALLCGLTYAAVTIINTDIPDADTSDGGILLASPSDETWIDPQIVLKLVPAYSTNVLPSRFSFPEPQLSGEAAAASERDRLLSVTRTQTGDNEMNISRSLATVVTAAALTAAPWASTLADTEPTIWAYYPADGTTPYARITDGQWVLLASKADAEAGTLSLGGQPGSANIKVVIAGSGPLDLSRVICHDGATGVDYQISAFSIAPDLFAGDEAITDLTLPPLPDALSNRMFLGAKITSVTVSSTKLETIGSQCFQHCYSLTNVNFDTPSLKIIEGFAFTGCLNLESDFGQILPPSVTTLIGGSQFEGCLKLKGKACLPNVTTISARMFLDCQMMEELEINNPFLTSIGELAFARCSALTNVVANVPNLKNIDFWAFRYCYQMVADVGQLVPPSITSLGEAVFDSCYKVMGKVSLPKVMGIPNYAFSGTGITEAEFTCPDLIALGHCAVASCPALTNVVIGSTNAMFSVDWASFLYGGSTLSATFWGPAPGADALACIATSAGDYTANFRVSRRQPGWHEFVTTPLAQLSAELQALAPPDTFGVYEVNAYKHIWMIHSPSPYDSKPTICIIN